MNGPGNPQSAAERRAARRAERHAERERARREATERAALASAGLDEDRRRRSLRRMAEARGQGRDQAARLIPRRPRLQLVLASVVAAVAALTAVGEISYGQGLRDGWVTVAGAAIVTGAAVSAWRAAAPHVPARLRNTTIVAAVVLAGLFALGATRQVVIDGRPVPERSTEAATYRFASRLAGELDQLTAADELLALDETQARVRVDDYEAARGRMADLVDRWAGKEGDAPNPELAAAVTALRNAAGLAERALDGKAKLTLQYDARLAAELDSLRAGFISEAVRAGGLIQTGASAGGVDLGAPAGVRE